MSTEHGVYAIFLFAVRPDVGSLACLRFCWYLCRTTYPRIAGFDWEVKKS